MPERLIASGPYQFSRNPMYVSEGTIWLGWTLYYGNPAVLAVGLALAGAIRYAVGREERTLRAKVRDFVDARTPKGRRAGCEGTAGGREDRYSAIRAARAGTQCPV